jgi:hypothetical protein
MDCTSVNAVLGALHFAHLRKSILASHLGIAGEIRRDAGKVKRANGRVSMTLAGAMSCDWHAETKRRRYSTLG